ncbi:PAS domain S-box-containing protein/diguanylate cyclase (GGDEF) domain-containing protein [Kosakonia arachidis]|uniref:diguanylate cyclase n=1 Tax=Kosakonia arachidis TaxID=551989 RepID=A0A1I7C034_9ENTR|nr:bifunctional diguanylate cyclase/phosphodiesterase [Kosakonia arachidis]SFT92775.1 PAS domain S-box-containing protein/diguanylate cyclase (GGDEF) domain-containing protein [Kosakonia arachidis]
MNKTHWDESGLFQAILDKCPVGIAVINYEGIYLTVNPAYCDIYGYTQNEMLNHSFTMIFPSADKLPVLERHQRFLEESTRLGGEWSVMHRDGSQMTVFSESVTFYPAHGLPARLVYVQNITERKKAQEQMKIAAAVFDASQEAIVVTNSENNIVTVNPAFTVLTGWSLEEVKGLNPREFKSGRHPTFFYTEMWQTLNETGQWIGDVWDRHKDGTEFLKELRISVIKDPDSNVINYVGMFSDITLRKKQEELIWQQANYDAVTGLPNRHLFKTKLEQAALHASRTRHIMALMLIDLDQFKSVNDSMGHRAGDELLGCVALRLLECAHNADCVARLGGDEFAIIIPDIDDPAECTDIARDILRTLDSPFTVNGEAIFVSASIGISLYPGDTENLEELFKNADQAMYAVKNAGRKNFRFYSRALHDAIHTRLRMIRNLRKALAENQFVVYYQPIISVKTGHITRMEALVRWFHPVQGLISPDAFIPLAEDTGLIVPIGNWIAKEAITQLAYWRQKYDPELKMTINLSPVQLRSQEFEDIPWIRDLQSHELDGEAVTIEITEGLLLNSEKRVNYNLKMIHQIGIQIAIDDFGTGYSSLAYLRKFNIDFLKIDRSFVEDLKGVGFELCTAIIAMAHSLGLGVIAEGVETEEQENLLIKLECDYMQGYLYSKPLPADEIEKLLVLPYRR